MPYSVAMLSVHTSPLDTPGRTKDAGGMNIYIRALAAALARRGIKVDIFTRCSDPQLPQIVQLDSLVRVIHISAGPQSPVHKHHLYQYLPTFARQIEEFRSSEDGYYDVVHSHYWLSGVAALTLAERWNVPHVTMFHTLARLKQMAHPDEPEPPLRLEMEQQLVQQVDHIIAATSDERSQLLRFCGAASNSVSVIPCGVDLELFAAHEKENARAKLGLETSRPLLLFAGRLDPFKGPDVLLRAASLMKEDALVVIVGGRSGQDEDVYKLRELAVQLGIAERVRFLEAQPQTCMPLLYSAADVTVVPSYHESFGFAAVESLACGTPVVATRAGGLMTVVQHEKTGFLVSRCPGFFAERLDALLRDPALRQHMSVAARSSVLQFGWAHVAEQVHHLYNVLVDEANCLLAQ
ncbi:glycosyltransferase [Ktedonospora formicarum]|uniref:Glycosyl transferase family 1 n=1 Tax=Ktedonospora formicarum TaxID=2778364 RepID=A0A8J3HXY9_9CHLR|nr:glycosyltransferase [Ktedonospora formicarum]GHO43155.1 glycosyl transferase family 1 [Ktedonospora formicarum]